MPFELPKLPYALDALHPHISKQTLEFHYGKHHQGYINNLNKLIPGTKFENATLEQIVREADGGIFNNGAQVWNHTFYFLSFSPGGLHEPAGRLAEAISKQYGSFDSFKEEFSKSAITLFGSGWVWMVKKEDLTLDIVQESNAGNPLRNGLLPLLTCDVWEHAYYLDYQNNRPDYLQAFWDILDWKVISGRYEG
ncbi:MAG: superoxide dismutase [Bacteroidales bacterium]|nr:superoxide dismutase [Bacteroidales bacterium]MBN2762534.1 superoxide dismutase [Bacteroidales bacterium]